MRELHISSEFAQFIAPALKEPVGERVTEVLPTLQSLFLEEPPSAVKEAIQHFVAAGQLAGAVHLPFCSLYHFPSRL